MRTASPLAFVEGIRDHLEALLMIWRWLTWPIRRWRVRRELAKPTRLEILRTLLR